MAAGQKATAPLPDTPLPGSIAEVVSSQAAERPDALALTFVDVDGSTASQTYGELRQRSWQTANALLAAGVGRGDRVAVLTTRRCTSSWRSPCPRSVLRSSG